MCVWEKDLPVPGEECSGPTKLPQGSSFKVILRG